MALTIVEAAKLNPGDVDSYRHCRDVRKEC